MSKKSFVPILAVIDLALLIVIIVSPVSSAGKASDKESTKTQITQEESSSPSADEDLSASVFEAGPPSMDGAAGPEPDEDPKDDNAPAGPPHVQQGSAETASGQKKTESAHASFPDVSVFNTSERPTAADFTWITPEILAGKCPAGSENMDFPEALGGWKCYIWDDEGVERFANMDFAGTEDNIRLTFDWYYTYIGSEGQGYDDNTPDSVYKGSLAGNVEAYGPGMVVLTDFYRMNDHQYAFGSIQWPDGISGHLAMVRP